MLVSVAFCCLGQHERELLLRPQHIGWSATEPCGPSTLYVYYIHIYIYIYIYMYVYTYTYTCVYGCTYVYMYICMYMHACMYVCMCMHACMYVYIHIYIYILHIFLISNLGWTLLVPWHCTLSPRHSTVLGVVKTHAKGVHVWVLKGLLSLNWLKGLYPALIRIL